MQQPCKRLSLHGCFFKTTIFHKFLKYAPLQIVGLLLLFWQSVFFWAPEVNNADRNFFLSAERDCPRPPVPAGIRRKRKQTKFFPLRPFSAESKDIHTVPKNRTEACRLNTVAPAPYKDLRWKEAPASPFLRGDMSLTSKRLNVAGRNKSPTPLLAHPHCSLPMDNDILFLLEQA